MGLGDAIDAAIDQADESQADESEQVTQDQPDPTESSNEDKGTPDKFLEFLQEKGIEGNRLEQAKRYAEKARKAAELEEQLESLKGKDALEDYIRDEYGSEYSDLDDMLEEHGSKKVMKLIKQDIARAAKTGDSEPESGPESPKVDPKVAELEKKLEAISDEIFETKMKAEVNGTLDALEVTGKDRKLLQEYIDERWYLAPPKMEMAKFVEQCHKKFMAIRGNKEETSERQDQEAEEKPNAKKVPPKPKDGPTAPRKRRSTKDLFDGPGSGLDRAIDRALGSGAS